MPYIVSVPEIESGAQRYYAGMKTENSVELCIWIHKMRSRIFAPAVSISIVIMILVVIVVATLSIVVRGTRHVPIFWCYRRWPFEWGSMLRLRARKFYMSSFFEGRTSHWMISLIPPRVVLPMMIFSFIFLLNIGVDHSSLLRMPSTYLVTWQYFTTLPQLACN